MIRRTVLICSLWGVLLTPLPAQLNLASSRIATGGGEQSSARFTVQATVSESIAGGQSGSSLNQGAGFLTQDFFAPIASCQSLNITLENGTATITPDQINLNSTDNVGIAQLSLDRTVFTTADLGQQSVTLTVTDYVGLSSECTAVVTVTESIIPTKDLWLFQ